MDIDFSQALHDLSGKPVNDGEKELTLKTVCVNALLSLHNDEHNLRGEEKVTRYELAKKIYESKTPINVSSESIVLLKQLVAKSYGPLIVGQIWNMLES